jgi:ribosomal protein S18 acetylase RimI-like enzyme
LYVAPEARTSGVARLILRRLEQLASEAGYSVLRLDTGAREPAALALVESDGYRGIADYNANPFGGHWLEKGLSAAGARYPTGRREGRRSARDASVAWLWPAGGLWPRTSW